MVQKNKILFIILLLLLFEFPLIWTSTQFLEENLNCGNLEEHNNFIFGEESKDLYSETKVNIKSGEKITKYLEPYKKDFIIKIQDSYFSYLHSPKNKLVINLAVYSGDAYLVQVNDIKGCKFDEEHFVSDERVIFHCDEDEMEEIFDINNPNEIKIEFSVRSGENGAVYSLYLYEQSMKNQDIYIPVEMAKFDIIENSNNYKLIYKTNETNVTNEILTLVNPINCDINLTNQNNIFYDNDFIQFSSSLNKSFTDIILKQYNNKNLIDKCLFYLSSYVYSNDDSYLLITENKPLKFRLNDNFDNMRLHYLYGMTNENKKIYLKISVIGNSAIKIKIINICDDNENEYIVKDDKIITIMNGKNGDIKGLTLNNLSELKIYVQLYPNGLSSSVDDKEVLVSLKIITDLNTPTILKKGEQLTDILINDEYKYYIALVNQGSSGIYHVNLNNENIGNIYGRLLDNGHIREIGGWNNRFVLPTSNSDKNKLLPFDYTIQQLFIQKGHTKYCNKFCYLLIGVNLNIYNKNIDFKTNNIITGFNSFLEEYNQKDDTPLEKNNFVKLANNEYISGYVTDDQSDLFAYNLNEYNSKLNISFTCDNCIITLMLNDTNFDSPKAKKFISNGDKKIISLGDKDKDDISNSTVYVKINTLNNEDNSKNNKNDIKYKYFIKLNAPNDLNESLNYIDSSIPETCDFDSKTEYHDYIIRLDTYNSEKDINIMAAKNSDSVDNNNINKNLKNEVEIYANIVKDGNLASENWPSREKHQFPSKLNSTNYLTINKNNIPKGENGKDDEVLLIRIYGKPNNKVDLYTNYEDINDKEKEDLLIPGKYQLITVNNSNSNSSFKIDIPSDLDPSKDYIYKIKKLDGNGKISYGEDTYELNDKYDSLTFPMDKNLRGDFNSINIKSINARKNNTYNDSFTFLIKYEEKNKLNSLEKTKTGSTFFSSKDDTESIEHFIPLDNINGDLPININFDTLNSNEEDEYKGQIRVNTEDFDINGYLVTEDELNDLKDGNISFLENKNDFKYKGNYYMENKHGFLNIKENDIKQYNQNNNKTKTYLYYTIKKSKKSDKKYDNIKGNINIYPSNLTNHPLPENDYHFDSIDCSQNNRKIYKLSDMAKIQNGEISSDTHNLTIDFSSPIEGLKVKVLKEINSTKEDPTYFGITRKENNNGKDTITISKNIEDLYLVIETPDTLLNKTDDIDTNINYMFKYSYEKKDKDKDTSDKIPKAAYNNTLIYNKMNFTDLKTNITLNKIKDSKTNNSLPCNYYIRIYKNKKYNNTQDNKNNYYKKKNISLINNNNDDDIYAIYKIESDNPILQNEKEDNFTVSIEIDTDEPVYVDIIAEDTTDNQFYGYSKAYPNSDEDNDNDKDNDNNDDKGENNDDNEEKNDDKDKDNKNSGGSLVKYILIIICVLLLLILSILCCVKTCQCNCFNCLKKDRASTTNGLDDISLFTNENEGDGNYTVTSYNN